MSVLAAIAVIGLSGGTPYPIAEVLGAAQHGCEVALMADDAGAALTKTGWTAIEPEPNSWIAADLRDEAEIYGAKLTPSKVFAIKAADQVLFAFLSSIKLDEGNLKLCAVMDRKAQLDTGPEQVVAWAGRAPTVPALVEPEIARELDKLSFTKTWKPGLHAGADDTVIRYLSAEYGGPGLVFTSERLVRKEVQ